MADSALLELIGKPAMVKLAEVFGGTRLYIPTNYLQAGEIVEAGGQESARILSDAYAGVVLKVPLCRELLAESYALGGCRTASSRDA